MTSLEQRTLAALMGLLLDDSPTVVAAARQKLRAMGEAGEKALRQAVAGDDAQLRVRARTALLEIRRENATARIAAFARGPEESISLEEGAFLLAQVEYPDLDRPAYTAILDALGDQLRVRVSKHHPPAALAAELARLLASEHRLRGNEEEFDDPDNSFLHRVLERRKGIPISLAAIYLLVAHRAGVEARGIGAPGHYLVRIGPPEADLFLDPLTGRRFPLQDAMRMLSLRGLPVTPEHFAETGVRDTLVRMCANLVACYERRGARPYRDRWDAIRESLRA